MDDVEVEEAVTIEIAPGGAQAPERIGQSGVARHLPERTAAFRIELVVKQRWPAPAGHQQIGPGVVVVVGDRNAVRVEPALAAVQMVQADGGRDVLETPAAEVAVQLARVALDVGLARAIEIAAAGEEQIE